MIGQTLGHYHILEKIGAGGMGEVYRAHDERLQRDVALKVLPGGTLGDEAARRRFRKEALALSKLNHPSIATIFDFDTQDGVDFLVMEHIAGVTLAEKLAAGALPEQEVARLGSQVAAALEEAHEQGVVHRDLKPSNIKVTPKGHVKVLDFGVARLLKPYSETATTETLTETQAVAGTLPYMAPEQLRGQPADGRSDLWALGVVLYEAATGGRPFQGGSGAELSAAILRERPRPWPPRVPAELQLVIERCLEKEPGRRYRRAGEVRAALEAVQSGAAPVAWRAWGQRLSRRQLLATVGAVVALGAVLVGFNVGGVRDRLRGRAGPPRIESLAVLPFENLSGDPQQEYFVDGMTESLITDLGRLTGLKRVIARGSVMRYKGTNKSLGEIGRELKVDALITGAVVRSGDRVRVTAQLINPENEEQLWAEHYERDLRDVLSLQNELTRTIAAEIRLKLAPEEQRHLVTARPVNPEAYDAYLKGMVNLEKTGQKNVRTALRYFEIAVQRDPQYALAYVGVANSWHAMMGGGPLFAVSPTEGLPKAKAAAMKAIELDDRLAEAHLALARVLRDEWDWKGAERELRRARELGPNDAEVCSTNLWFELFKGRSRASQAELDRCLALDPLSPSQQDFYASYLLNTGRTDEAIAVLEKLLRLDPEIQTARYRLFLAYRRKGRYEDAFQARKTHRIVAGDEEMVAAMERGHRQGGFSGAMLAAAKVMAERSKHQFIRKVSIAEAYLYAGAKDRAIEWLEKAFDERSPALVDLKFDQRWDELRSDPRFQALLRRMKFPE